MGCSLVDMANAGLTQDETYELTRVIRDAASGEFRNISVLHEIATLSLEGTPMGDAGATVLADAFGPRVPLPNVIRLALGAAQITGVGASVLAGTLSAAGSTVESLRLDWNHIGDAGASAIGRALRGNQKLHVLGLERCGVGDAGATAIAIALGASDPSAESLYDPLEPAATSAMEELRLEGNRIGAAGAVALADALRVNHRLTSLSLALNPLGPEGARAIASALKHNRGLTMLDLGECSIGEVGAAALGRALRGNTVLRSLKLHGNAIGSRGAASIAAALEINPTALRELNMRMNQVDAAAATTLLEAVIHAKASPDAAGPGLSSLRLEHSNVLPTRVGAGRAPPAINASLLAEVERALRLRAPVGGQGQGGDEPVN